VVLIVIHIIDRIGDIIGMVIALGITAGGIIPGGRGDGIDPGTILPFMLEEV
jgi:hypothetical protein